MYCWKLLLLKWIFHHASWIKPIISKGEHYSLISIGILPLPSLASLARFSTPDKIKIIIEWCYTSTFLSYMIRDVSQSSANKSLYLSNSNRFWHKFFFISLLQTTVKILKKYFINFLFFEEKLFSLKFVKYQIIFLKNDWFWTNYRCQQRLIT